MGCCSYWEGSAELSERAWKTFGTNLYQVTIKSRGMYSLSSEDPTELIDHISLVSKKTREVSESKPLLDTSCKEGSVGT